MEAGADDNQRIMTSDSFLPKKPVIMQLSASPADFLSCRDWPSAETPGVNELPGLAERKAARSQKPRRKILRRMK
jgi:hypothetical protein